uniref:Glyoxalase n=1 Tax=Schlesneria paludicola TaxID=360056 RepID=A0A7C2JY62_9PLAN
MFACGFAISPNDDHMQVECVKYLLYVQDMSRAVAFHRDVLGLTVRMESPGWSEVARGDALIGLHAGGDGQQRVTALSFQVTDLDAALNEITSRGGRVVDPPESRPGEPIRLARFADTEGNVVMLIQYTG